jgi:eukaryotic-like serine/threonine-protein kinase
MGAGPRVVAAGSVAERVMQQDRWNRIKEIFGSIVDCAPEAREQLLDRLCAGDAELRAEIGSLLAAHDTGAIIDRPAALALFGTGFETPHPAWIGRRLGPYRIVEELGSGGMGEVYRAVRADDEYEKEVAVKVLRAGLDIDALLRHFRVEKQILASLDHPNIARLLDAGSSSEGQPFFVMDFIRGRPIDAYCTEQRLDIPARLTLFRALCGAVQYVHQHLMVHADLKCDNVLVTDDGTVKLLDFGIAKLLNPSPALSRPDAKLTGWVALTPEYASPEQIRGEPCTTASDVYSLGVVLFRLLTGVLPHGSAAGGRELVANTFEQEAASVSMRLPGELHSIVTMALQKQPANRYSSVEQLSEDVRRYMSGFPVLAHKGSVGYLVRKFVGRHKASTSIAGLLCLSLVGGVVTTSWQAHVARIERARAERHAENVRKLADTLLFDVHGAIANLPGATAARQTLVANSLQYLDALSAERAENPALRRNLASAYEQVGTVQGARLGNNVGSIASYRKALAIRTDILAAEPDNEVVRRELVRNYGMLADMVFFVDDLPTAIELIDQMISLAEKQVQANPHNAIDRRNLGHAYGSLGWFLSMSGDASRGLPLLEKAMSIFAELAKVDPSDMSARRRLSIMYGRYGHVLRLTTDRHADSQAMQEKSLEVLSALTQTDPLNADLLQLKAYALLGIGWALTKQGEPRAALEKQLQAVSWLRLLLEADPMNDRARFDAARALSETGVTLAALGEMRQAEKNLTESLHILSTSVGAAATEMTIERALMAFTVFHLGRLSVFSGTDARLPNETRAKHCRQAQSWFERSSPLLAATERTRTWHLYVKGLSLQQPQLLAECHAASQERSQ